MHSPDSIDPTEHEVAFSPEQKRNLFLIYMSVVVCGMGFGLTFPLLSLTLEEIGTPEYLIGANASMFALAAITFLPFVPAILSRTGARLFFQLAIGVTVICLLLFKFFPNIWIWFPLRYIVGAAINGMFVVGEVWILNIASANAKGRSIALFSMSLSGGFALGPMTLMVTGTEGWLPFIAGGFVLSLGIFPLFWAKDIKPSGQTQNAKKMWGIWKLAPLPLIAAMIFGILENSKFNFLPIYGVRTVFTVDTVALLLVALALGDMVCQWFIGNFADRHNKRLVLAGLGLLCCICPIFIPFALQAKPLLYALVFIWGGATMGMYTIAMAMLGDRFKGGDLSSASAMLGVVYGVGAMLGPIGVGKAMDVWDPHGLMAAMAFVGGTFTLFAFYRLVAKR